MSHVACPQNGLYWERYRLLIGRGNLCDIPHRTLNIQALIRISRFIRSKGIQVIHSHGMSGGIYGRLLGMLHHLPCMHTFHGLPRTLSFKHRLYYQAERVLSRFTHLGIAVSAGEARLITLRYAMYRGRLATIENGIEHSVADFQNRSNRLPVQPAEKKMIVSFTRLNDQKNPWLVIDIAEELRRQGELDDLRFCLYGEKMDDPRFRRKIEAAGLKQHIHLYPPTDNPTALLAKAFAYLSTSRWEGMPLALLEAHREGACVVASKVIGNRDLISDGRSGMLYPEGDGIAAANCIVALKSDRHLRGSLRTHAASRCREHHNRDIMVARLQTLYRLISDPSLQQRRRRSLLVAANSPMPPPQITAIAAGKTPIRLDAELAPSACIPSEENFEIAIT